MKKLFETLFDPQKVSFQVSLWLLHSHNREKADGLCSLQWTVWNSDWTWLSYDYYYIHTNVKKVMVTISSKLFEKTYANWKETLVSSKELFRPDFGRGHLLCSLRHLRSTTTGVAWIVKDLYARGWKLYTIVNCNWVIDLRIELRHVCISWSCLRWMV